MFLPGSQISDKPLKDISHLMNEPQKFALIKLDKVRGNACVSRKEIISSFKKEDKAKIIEKYKVGDIIKDAEVKGYSTFGCFFNVNGELDVLVHLQEISYSRVNHPDEVFNIGEKHDLKVISVDKEKLQVGCSVKQLSPDPFEHIENYDLNKVYKVKVVKIMDFGAFCELEPGLTTLLHSSELSWTKKNVSAKKMFKVGDEIDCVITEIDKEKRRVAISHRLSQENPFEVFEKKFPIGSTVEGAVVNKNEYSLFVSVKDLDLDAFLHCNDLTYLNNGEEELKKYKDQINNIIDHFSSLKKIDTENFNSNYTEIDNNKVVEIEDMRKDDDIEYEHFDQKETFLNAPENENGVLLEHSNDMLVVVSAKEVSFLYMFIYVLYIFICILSLRPMTAPVAFARLRHRAWQGLWAKMSPPPK